MDAVGIYGRFLTILGPNHLVKKTGSRRQTLIIRVYFGFEGFSAGIPASFANQ